MYAVLNRVLKDGLEVWYIPVVVRARYHTTIPVLAVSYQSPPDVVGTSTYSLYGEYNTRPFYENTRSVCTDRRATSDVGTSRDPCPPVIIMNGETDRQNKR